MMRSYTYNLHVDPVRTEMSGTQQIPILHVCDLDKSESKEILAENIIASLFYGRKRIRMCYCQ